MKFSKEQKAYFKAVAEVEAKKAIKDGLMAGESMGWESDVDIEAYCGKEIAAGDSSGYRAAVDVLRASENSMLDWMMSVMKAKCSGNEGYGLVASMYGKMKYNVVVRHKMIDLAATLVA